MLFLQKTGYWVSLRALLYRESRRKSDVMMTEEVIEDLTNHAHSPEILLQCIHKIEGTYHLKGGTILERVAMEETTQFCHGQLAQTRDTAELRHQICNIEWWRRADLARVLLLLILTQWFNR